MVIPSLRLRTITAFLLLLAVVLGCDQKNGDPAPITNTVVGNWRFSTFKVDPALAGITDLFVYVASITGSTCLTDVTVTFKNDGTTALDAPKSCQNVSSSDITGIDNSSTWSLSNGKMSLTRSNGTSAVYDTSFSGNTMSLTFKEDDTDPTSNITRTYTYTLQLVKV